MTYLGLDLGSKTCGIAISDRTGLIASSLEVIRYDGYDELVNKLNNIVSLETFQLSVPFFFFILNITAQYDTVLLSFRICIMINISV